MKDQTEQKLLFDKFYGKAGGVAFRYFDVESDKEATKVVQDSFVEFLKKGKEDFESLRKIIVLNSVKGKEINNMFPTRNVPDVNMEEICNELKKKPSDDSINMVRSLPESQRIVFNMLCLDGFTQEDLVTMFGTSESVLDLNYKEAKNNIVSQLIPAN